jgi:hypothetical protein
MVGAHSSPLFSAVACPYNSLERSSRSNSSVVNMNRDHLAHDRTQKEQALRNKSSLSFTRQRIVEAMQFVNHGQFEGLPVRDGEPLLLPPVRVVKDTKIGAADNGARAELEAEDFTLKKEHIEFFETLDRIGNGIIACLEVKAGLPFRVRVEQQLEALIRRT